MSTSSPCAEPSVILARRRLVWTVVVTSAVAVLTASQLLAVLFSSPSGTTAAIDITCAVLAVLIMPALQRFPVPATLLVTLLAVVSPAATPATSFGVFHLSIERRFRVAVAVGATAAGAHIARWWWRPIPGLSPGWWIVLVLVGAATLIGWGGFIRARRALVMSLHERVTRAESEQADRIAEARLAERHRIAREMHDVLAHRLSLLATYAGALEYRPDASPERLSQAAGVVRAAVHHALDELRDVITVLRTDEPDAAATLAPQPTLLDLPRLVDESRSAGTAVTLDVDPQTSADTADAPATLGRAAYRVVQEALTNARRHASGAAVRIRVTGQPGGELVVEVRNPLRHSETSPDSGMGLVGLAERVSLLGGRLESGAHDGEFVLLARLPWMA